MISCTLFAIDCSLDGCAKIRIRQVVFKLLHLVRMRWASISQNEFFILRNKSHITELSWDEKNVSSCKNKGDDYIKIFQVSAFNLSKVATILKHFNIFICLQSVFLLQDLLRLVMTWTNTAIKKDTNKQMKWKRERRKPKHFMLDCYHFNRHSMWAIRHESN